MKRLAVSFVLVLAACDKSAPPSSDGITTTTAAPPAPTPLVSATPTLAASASVMPSASAAPGSSARVEAKGATPGPSAVTKKVDGSHYSLELAANGCKAGAECALTIRLAAAGDYHINKEYPYKFTANAAPGVELLAKSTPNVFSRDSGDFTVQGEKAAVMTVRFKPAAKGQVPISGTYKLSVCSEDQCQIEQEKLALDVPVL